MMYKRQNFTIADIAEKDVGWQYSGEGAWRYVPTRRMSDTIQHPANQGTVNGQPDICEPNRQEEDHISRKLNEMQVVKLNLNSSYAVIINLHLLHKHFFI